MSSNIGRTALDIESGLMLGIGCGCLIQKVSSSFSSPQAQKIALLVLSGVAVEVFHDIDGAQPLIAKHAITLLAIAECALDVSHDVAEMALRTLGFTLFSAIGTELFELPSAFTIFGCMFNYIRT